jgi:hypothetical protein
VRFNDFILKNPDYDVINKLRLFAGVFTGQDLLKDFTLKGLLSDRKKFLNAPNESLAAISHVGVEQLERYEGWIRAILPEEYLVETPNILGELGFLSRGVICNFHTLSYFERMAILYECGALSHLKERSSELKRGLSFLEVGAGYGFLAYMLERTLPTDRYFIIDIPESLLFSSIYLGLALPEKRIVLVDDAEKTDFDAPGVYFIPNMFWETAVGRIRGLDAAINTLSFHEMLRGTVESYADGIKTIFASNPASSPGFLFEQNFENAEEEVGCNAKKILRSKFFSEAPSVYTAQTRGYAELHAPDRNTLELLRRSRPEIPLGLKLRSRLAPSYLMAETRKRIPKKLKRAVRRVLNLPAA